MDTELASRLDKQDKLLLDIRDDTRRTRELITGDGDKLGIHARLTMVEAAQSRASKWFWLIVGPIGGAVGLGILKLMTTGHL